MEIPTVLEKIYEEFSEDRIPAVAGGVTFFFLPALFPAIASVVSLYGLFADRQAILESLEMISGFLPNGAVSVLSAEVHRLTAQKPATLNIAFALSSFVALWSTSGGIKAVLDGLNIAFETAETRSFVRLSLNALSFAIGGVSAAAAIIFAVTAARHISLGKAWDGYLKSLVAILVWPAAFILCSTVVSLIYRYGPNRVRTPWRWITWGSAFTSLFWIIGTLAFSWYVKNFGSYNRTYGELGAAVGFLTWVWISVVILLTGAEIICEVERAPSRKRRK